MFGDKPLQEFPRLNPDNCIKTSEQTKSYNCFAWAAGQTDFRWEPDPYGMYYWPPSAPRALTLDAFVNAYREIGYELCQSDNLEVGFEKIAIYASEASVPTHVARQLLDGKWTSKLGDFEDITHNTLNALNGPLYGEARLFMKRKREP